MTAAALRGVQPWTSEVQTSLPVPTNASPAVLPHDWSAAVMNLQKINTFRGLLLQVSFLQDRVEACSTSVLTTTHKTGPFVRGCCWHLKKSTGINVRIRDDEPRGFADVS